MLQQHLVQLPPFRGSCWYNAWLLVASLYLQAIHRYAVISAIIIPFVVWWIKPEFISYDMVCCLLFYRHHDNIQRLWRHQEDKVWDKFKKK